MHNTWVHIQAKQAPHPHKLTHKYINLLPNNKILDLPNIKAFEDDKFWICPTYKFLLVASNFSSCLHGFLPYGELSAIFIRNCRLQTLLV